MKNLKVALACISLAALSGCSSEIDVIREGRLELLPEYTVGQALDNRKLCESTDWSVIEDERGRDVVRYTCDFKDIENAVSSNNCNPFTRRANHLAAP